MGATIVEWYVSRPFLSRRGTNSKRTATGLFAADLLQKQRQGWRTMTSPGDGDLVDRKTSG
jgi:hypothetical protein